MSVLDSIQYLKALRSMERSNTFNKQAGYGFYKSAAQPPAGPPPGGDPSMGGGAPPMDPSMMGGMPPMDPSMMGGMPPMDPSMMGGMPPAAPPAAPPAGGGGGAPAGQSPQETEQKVTNKIKTEQWMQHIDSYNYNLLKLMINLYEHLGIPVPAESLIQQPLGSTSPSAGDISGMMGAAATATAPQSPTDAMANGDVTPPGGGAPMDPGMMDPAMMGGDPSMGGMPPEGAGPEGMPPDAGMPPKQSSWNGYRQTSWRAPYKRQVGVSPVNRSANTIKRAGVFQYPVEYADMFNKLNKLNRFN